jgi:hypothetical protein
MTQRLPDGTVTLTDVAMVIGPTDIADELVVIV